MTNHHLHSRQSLSGTGSVTTTSTTVANATAMQTQSKRFPSILVARSNLVRPSELEVCLRPHCQRQRVIEKLNGAHIVIPGQGETTMAMRAYYPIDLKHQQQQQQENDKAATTLHDRVLQHIHRQEQNLQNQPPHHDLGDDHAELNGLRLFQRSFAVTFVFFVLPQDSPERKHQFDDIGSFMHRATSLLMDNPQQTRSNNGNDKNKKSTSIRMTRVFVVEDTAQVIEYIMALADTLLPEKRLLKRAFSKRQRDANFMPIDNNLDADKGPQEQKQQHAKLDAVAASHTAGVFRQWASNFQLPPGEADVLMKISGGLQGTLTATEDQLAAFPIEDRTRKLLQMFFQSSPSSSAAGYGTTTNGGGTVAAAGQDRQQRYYYHPPNHPHQQHQVNVGSFAGATTAPSVVGHENVWNGTAASSAMYGGASATYNPSCPVPTGPHAISGPRTMNGNHIPHNTVAAMYPSSNPQSFKPMTTAPSSMGGHQSLPTTGGAMTPWYPQQQQQQQQQHYHHSHPQQQDHQHHQHQHGPPATHGQPYLQGGQEAMTMMEPSFASMYYENNGNRLAGGGGGGGGGGLAGGGGPFPSQREQMRRWM